MVVPLKGGAGRRVSLNIKRYYTPFSRKIQSPLFRRNKK